MRDGELDVVRQPVEGRRLIEANAGTGKTYAIQHLYLRLLLEGATPPGVKDILVVTFTDAAAAELRERIRGNIVKALAIAKGQAKLESQGADLAAILSQFIADGSFDFKKMTLLKRAILEFDEASISTIHGFCSKTLSENAFESGIPFDAELSNDAGEALEIFVKDFWRRVSYPKEKALVASILKARGFGLDELLRFARSIPDPKQKFTPERLSFDETATQRDVSELKSCWPSVSAEAKRLLLESKELSRSADLYKESRVDFHFARMDRFAAGLVPPPFDTFKFLSKAQIDDGVTGAKKAKGIRGPSHPAFDLCQRIDESVVHCVAALKRKLAEELESGVVRRLKSRAGVMDFDDILLDLDSALRGPSAKALKEKLALRYKAVLIDEFQDTDPVQFRIFDTAFGGSSTPLFMIGDPKQSIYAFRHADVFSYDKVKRGSSTKPPLTLSRNFRSTKEMVESVNKFFSLDSPFRKPFVFDGDWLNYTPSEAGDGGKSPLLLDGKELLQPLRCVYFESASGKPMPAGAAEDMAIADTANRIAELMLKSANGQAAFDDGKGMRRLEASDIAVLVDSNRNASRVKAELVARGVPAVLQKSSDVFKTAEALDLYRVLSAAASPQSPAKVKAALCSSFIAVAPSRLAGFSLDGACVDEFKLWLEYFAELRSIWEGGGLICVLSSLLDAKPERIFDDGSALPEEMRRSVKSRLLAKAGGERAVANLRQIAESLISESAAMKLDLEGQLSLLSRLIASNDDDEERECRLESDEDAVKVMTVHKSKGLQFPVVFSPLLWRKGVPEGSADFRYHDAAKEMRVCLDPASDPSALGAYKEEALAELVRLVYVAFTRASRLCVFHFGQINKADKSALAYLLDDPVVTKQGFIDDGAQIPLKDSIIAHLGECGAVDEPMMSPPACGAAQHEIKPSNFSARVFADFGSRIDNSRGVLSFSDLAAHLPVRVHEIDEAPGSSGEDLLPGFKPGAVAGECIHKFLELFDLSLFDSDPASAESEGLALARDCVASFGLAGRKGSATYSRRAEALPRQLLEMARRLAYLQLDGVESPFLLAKIRKGKTVRELEFDFSVRERLTAKLLNSLLRKDGFEGAKSLLGERFDSVAALLPQDADSQETRYIALRERSRRAGVMNGKADLILEAGGRYHIIDWKSNFLGPSPCDYAPDKLFADMLARGYVLQYHIYALALHLHLSAILPDYDYDKHFGNVIYVYARGIGKESGAFVDRPSRALIEALQKALQGGEAQ